MRLRIIRMDLPLKHVAIVSGSSISAVRSLIVELDQDGLRGYGEVGEDSRLGITVDKIAFSLEKTREFLSHYALADPCAFLRAIKEQLIKNQTESTFNSIGSRNVGTHTSVTPQDEKEIELVGNEKAALAILEMAACDLWGKLLNRPLWKLWDLNIKKAPLSSYTLTLDSVYKILEKFNEYPNWPVYRIKLGSSVDLDILRELRKRTEAPFRIDINGNWTLYQTMTILNELKGLGVELIEQPLPPENWEDMLVLHQKSSIPIFADESCQSLKDIERCALCFDGINLKPSKFGGLFPTLTAIGKAKELGLKTMIGHSIESPVAASAIAHFAPLLDYVYLDGPMLINRRIGHGVQLDAGTIIYPRENGSGIRFGER